MKKLKTKRLLTLLIITLFLLTAAMPLLTLAATGNYLECGVCICTCNACVCDLDTHHSEHSEITIEEDTLPLAIIDIVSGETWTLMNLILTVAGAAIAVLLVVRIFLRNGEYEEDEDNEETGRNRLPLLIAIPALAFIGAVLFLLTQDITNPMVMVDYWTFAHTALFAGGLLSYIFAIKKVTTEDQESINA